MKKIIALFCIVASIAALAACSGGSGGGTESTAGAKPAASTSATKATTATVTNEYTDKSGIVTEREYYDRAGTLLRREVFFKSGLMKEMFTYNSQGMAERYELYSYDRLGELTGTYAEIGKYDKTGKTLEKKTEQKLSASGDLLEETVYKFTNGVVVSGNATKYNENGKKIYTGVIYLYGNSGLKEVSGTHYAEDGEITRKEKMEYSQDGKITAATVSEYDPGFIIRKKTEQKYESQRIISHEYFYDAEGDMEKSELWELYPETEERTVVYYTYYKSNGKKKDSKGYGRDGKLSAYTAYHENGRTDFKYRIVNIDGAQYWCHEIYDEESRLESASYYGKEDEKLFKTVKYQYHENGNRKKTETFNAAGELIAYTEYNKYGNVTNQFPEK